MSATRLRVPCPPAVLFARNGKGGWGDPAPFFFDGVDVLTSWLRRCSRDESGVSSIDYALLACVIAVVCVVVVTATGLNTLALYTWVCTEVQAVMGGPGC